MEDFDQETFLWSHAPAMSAAPTILLYHFYSLSERSDDVDEAGVFQLENGKFLYISFTGIVSNLSAGYTECKEFETLEEAKNMFDYYYGEEGLNDFSKI